MKKPKIRPQFKPQLRWASVHKDGGPDDVFHLITTRVMLKAAYPHIQLMRVLVTEPPKRRKKK